MRYGSPRRYCGRASLTRNPRGGGARKSKDDLRERHDNGPVPAEDAPADGDCVRGEDDHRGAERYADDEREPEALEDLGDLLPEVRPLDLLLGRAPCDVVREEVREQRLGQVDTEPAEEEKAAGAVTSVLLNYAVRTEREREEGRTRTRKAPM